jgi:multiple antibiotic resistance protein
MSWSFLQGEWAYFTGALVSIFFIVDPFGVVPIYLTIAKRFNEADQRAIRRKSTVIATAILVLFAVSGMRFFQVFGITLPAFQIGGGLVLLIMGVKQLDSERRRVQEDEEDESLERDNVTIFPMATPLLAGPAAISTVILYSTSEPSPLRLAELILAVLIVMLLCYVVLSFSPLLLRVLGKTGLNILTRLMGLVLVAVAVQFVLTGLQEALLRNGAGP